VERNITLLRHNLILFIELLFKIFQKLNILLLVTSFPEPPVQLTESSVGENFSVIIFLPLGDITITNRSEYRQLFCEYSFTRLGKAMNLFTFTITFNLITIMSNHMPCCFCFCFHATVTAFQPAKHVLAYIRCHLIGYVFAGLFYQLTN
jgi:hypothetical protein